MNHATTKSRLLLWVDAVGGFFVCLGGEVRMGQAAPDATIDLPMLADLSRHHATFHRDEEGYTIEPLRDVKLNHERIASISWINDGSLLEMGPALKLRFRRPHPLSATARLDFVSHHRTQPSSSAVLLMADTLILGPETNNHVVCRGWPHDVILHRQHGGLFCTSSTPSKWTAGGTTRGLRWNTTHGWWAKGSRLVWRRSEKRLWERPLPAESLAQQAGKHNIERWGANKCQTMQAAAEQGLEKGRNSRSSAGNERPLWWPPAAVS